MTDYASFKHGLVPFPLTLSAVSGNALLRDADPALYYLLDFYAAMLETHLGDRIVEAATAAGVSHIEEAVAETLPLNPEPFLAEEHIRFPLLSAYRKSSKFEDIGQHKHSVDEFDVSYVLPPLQAGEAEQLLPILKAVVGVLDNRTEQGFDPTYTPPGSSAGASPWDVSGITSAEIKGASYGSYEAADNLFYPCVVLQVEVKEKSAAMLSEFETLAGINANIDVEDPAQETTLSDVVEIATYEAPTVTVASPNSGTKAGGTSVTLTGTNFRVGTTPTVTFGDVEATSVTVVNATTITCVTPAHDAFTTFIADVVVTNIDGQSGTLVAGYSFTTP